MSAVIAVPELMAQAATDLARIGDTLDAAHLTAALPTVAVLPAAADEVSTGIAELFSGFGQEYQKVTGQVAEFHADFAQKLTASAASYASAEDAITALLQPLNPILSSAGANLFSELALLLLGGLVIGFLVGGFLIVGLLGFWVPLLILPGFLIYGVLNFVVLPALGL